VTALDRLLPRGVVKFAAAGTFDPDQAPMAVASAPVAVASGSLPLALRADRALDQVNESVGRSIPAVRRAVHVIAGTISTFPLSAWRDGIRLRDEQLAAAGLTWLHQPDPQKTLTTTLVGTLQDAIWRDRSYWLVLDRYVNGYPAQFRRLQPDRVSVVEDVHDPDLLETVIVDGQPVPLRRVVMHNWSGIGGLRRWGFEILDLYLALQAAAARYAVAPHPKAILKNHGADLADDEVDALLAQWEAARDTRSVGYLNDVVDYETFGWNASEMQLVEAREHAALEVARLFGLPAWALDATGGDSMTYSNVTDRRSDLVESLRPWMTPVEQTLSAALPRGVTVTFDATAYTRDAPEARMRTWAAARAAGVLSEQEIRRAEPLADLSVQAPTPSTPATPPPTATSPSTSEPAQEALNA
jgi:HK97 family phage portal protein